MRGYTTADVIKMLRQRQGKRAQREFAAEIGVTQQYICDILGENRGPGKKVLDYLGLEPGFIKSQSAT